ncbi:hypothetical protein Tco_1024144 [Tanacetum coccineum]
MNELTNKYTDSKIFCPEGRIKELELRTQRRNNFKEELVKDRFPTNKELAYHKELLGEPQPPLSTLDPKIKRGDPWSLKIPCVIGTVYIGHAYIDLQSPVNIMSRAYYNKIREKSFQARGDGVTIYTRIRGHQDTLWTAVRNFPDGASNAQVIFDEKKLRSS